MGFISWFIDKVDDVKDRIKDKVEEAVWTVEEKLDEIKNFFSGKKYDDTSLEDQIDVDKVLEEFRKKIEPEISQVEELCMEKIPVLFNDMREKVNSRFSDLVELLDEEQTKATKKLSGTIMKYVKEHLSINDEKFVKVLKMKQGHAKDEALDAVFERVLERAQTDFSKKLKKYVEYLQEEFTTRLEIRMSDEEEQMNKRINKLIELEEKAKRGSVDVEAVIDERAPIMETAQCIIVTMEKEE